MTLQKIREDLELLRIEATNNYLGQDGKSIVVASDFKDAEQGLEAVIVELDAYIEEEEKANHYYNLDDWEVTYPDIAMLEDEFDDSSARIMRVGRLKNLPPKYMIQNFNEDDELEDYPWYDTEEEAQTALDLIKESQCSTNA